MAMAQQKFLSIVCGTLHVSPTRSYGVTKKGKQLRKFIPFSQHIPHAIVSCGSVKETSFVSVEYPLKDVLASLQNAQVARWLEEEHAKQRDRAQNIVDPVIFERLTCTQDDFKRGCSVRRVFQTELDAKREHFFVPYKQPRIARDDFFSASSPVPATTRAHRRCFVLKGSPSAVTNLAFSAPPKTPSSLTVYVADVVNTLGSVTPDVINRELVAPGSRCITEATYREGTAVPETHLFSRYQVGACSFNTRFPVKAIAFTFAVLQTGKGGSDKPFRLSCTDVQLADAVLATSVNYWDSDDASDFFSPECARAISACFFGRDAAVVEPSLLKSYANLFVKRLVREVNFHVKKILSVTHGEEDELVVAPTAEDATPERQEALSLPPSLLEKHGDDEEVLQQLGIRVTAPLRRVGDFVVQGYLCDKLQRQRRHDWMFDKAILREVTYLVRANKVAWNRFQTAICKAYAVEELRRSGTGVVRNVRAVRRDGGKSFYILSNQLSKRQWKGFYVHVPQHHHDHDHDNDYDKDGGREDDQDILVDIALGKNDRFVVVPHSKDPL
jgi:hypothetical protein